jgi:DNA-directed RNA polymerase subunit RPC12/RpoP
MKAYDRAIGIKCPKCSFIHVGIICHVKEIYICMKCNTEFTEEEE